MKKFLITVIAGLLSYFTACTQDNIVKHENVKKSDILVIDNRSAGEFNSGHIDGAILIPFNEIGAKIASVAKSKDTPIALYCRSGSRSSVALRTLESMGYTNVVNYGGMSRAKGLLDKKK